MGDLFEEKNIKPMLIAEQKEPFDSADYIYEIKFDGHRSIAYLDDKTDLRNKRDISQINWLPELKDIHKQVNAKCILDGEIVVFKNGDPDFYEVQRRALLRDSFKIQLAASKFPATYIAYDILYYKGKEMLNIPLIERKELLQSVVSENGRIIVSRYIEQYGTQLYSIVKQKKLEGIVAKKKDSKYQLDKRSKLWIKCKIYNSIDAVVCGFMRNKEDRNSIIVGQYNGTKLVYKAHVILGAGMKHITNHGYKIIDESPFGYVPYGSEKATWIRPDIVCIIEYMPSERESMRLAVFKGIREDKSPYECQVDEWNEVE